ncbi:MAG: hypothetical protein ACFE9O_02190 [Promethearchaeota archaeon]
MQTATRRIVGIGNSRGITFPHDCKHLVDDSVHLLYNERFILILRQDQSHLLEPAVGQIVQEAITQIVQDSLNQECVHLDSTGENPTG